MTKLINSQYYKDQRNKRYEYFNSLNKVLAEYEELKKQYKVFCQTARYYEKKTGITVDAELDYYADEIEPDFKKEAKELARMYLKHETEFPDILDKIEKTRKGHDLEVGNLIGLVYVYEEIIESVEDAMKDGIFDKNAAARVRRNAIHMKNRNNHIKHHRIGGRNQSVLRARKTAPKHKKTGVASLKNAYKRMI